MNQTSPTDDLRMAPGEDHLDRLTSAFFKSKMKHPWPPAPTTSVASEPSLLVATRTNAPGTLAARAHEVESPRNQPASASRDARGDHGNKARLTLAVSVAVLLGTCWYLSNGFPTSHQNGPAIPGGSRTPSLLKDAGASDPAALNELRKDKAENGNGNEGSTLPKIKLP